MPDRKKIENGVHHCSELHVCMGCPYRCYEDCTDALFRDCMELIRELEKAVMKPRPIVWGKRERITER